MLLSNYLFRSDVTIAFHVFLILAKRYSGGVKAALFFTAKAKSALFEEFIFIPYHYLLVSVCRNDKNG